MKPPYRAAIQGRSTGYAEGAEKSDEYPPLRAPLRAEPRRGADDLHRDQQKLRTPPPEPHLNVYVQTTGMGGERGLPPCRTFGGGQPHYSAQQHYEPTSYRRTPRRTTHTGLRSRPPGLRVGVVAVTRGVMSRGREGPRQHLREGGNFTVAGEFWPDVVHPPVYYRILSDIIGYACVPPQRFCTLLRLCSFRP